MMQHKGDVINILRYTVSRKQQIKITTKEMTTKPKKVIEIKKQKREL